MQPQAMPAQLAAGLGSWEKLEHCCIDYFGRPMCTYFVVPVWYDCFPLTPTCFTCRPPGLR
jgi:hypothetical protein